MKEEEKDYGDQFAYKNIEHFEEIAGYKVNQVFRDAWRMARVTNKQLGITKKETQDEQY